MGHAHGGFHIDLDDLHERVGAALPEPALEVDARDVQEHTERDAVLPGEREERVDVLLARQVALAREHTDGIPAADAVFDGLQSGAVHISQKQIVAALGAFVGERPAEAAGGTGNQDIHDSFTPNLIFKSRSLSAKRRPALTEFTSLLGVETPLRSWQRQPCAGSAVTSRS